jgi:predicted DNA-binding transcriptional regulator AlpA
MIMGTSNMWRRIIIFWGALFIWRYKTLEMSIIIPGENEIKAWVKEAIKEYFDNAEPTDKKEWETPVSRKEIAAFLEISLVTLHDWMKRGLPSHKQRGRVYFIKSEVLEYIKMNGWNN